MESERFIEGEADLPFQEKIDLGVFYDGPGRGEILAQLLEAVDGGAPLMVLSGSEGNGKTTLCRMVEQRSRGSLAVVFFAHTVESFEDVVRRIVATLQLQLVETEEIRGIDGAVEQIVAHLAGEDRRVLLIFDEAEDIYLATLERIRKMLDRVTAAGARMQILFSGRKAFLENCEQLAICDFRNNDGVRVDLPSLTEEQSAAYLRSIAEKTLPPEKMKVFNDEVVRNIHDLAKGRPRRLNLLARESLRSHGDDTSFMTLLDSVREESLGEDIPKKPARRLGGSSSSLRWLIGAAVIAAIGVLLLRPSEQVKLRDEAMVGKVATPGAPVVLLAPVEEPQPEVAPVSPGAMENSPQQSAVESSDLTTEGMPKISEEAAQADSSVTDGTLAPVTVAEASAERVTAVIEAPPAPPPAEERQATPATEKVVVLKPVVPLKVRPASWTQEQKDSAKPAAKNDRAEATATLTVDQLYQKRVQAGLSWMNNANKKEMFTVQLMVLTAKNAEANFKKMLTQANYRQEAGNFYIFKKGGSPEVVWVFYGEYPSLELARLAQNSLPPFLRERQPYAIAIKGAISKVLGK